MSTSWLAAGSAVQVMPIYFVTWWNVFFSSLPVIVYGFGDQDVPKDVSAEAVELYGKGLRREFYTHLVFARWIVEAFYMGAVCALAPTLAMVTLEVGDAVDRGGMPVDIGALGWAIMVNVTVCVNLRFSLECHSFTLLEGATLFLMFFALEMYALDVLTIFPLHPLTSPYIPLGTRSTCSRSSPRPTRSSSAATTSTASRPSRRRTGTRASGWASRSRSSSRLGRG